MLSGGVALWTLNGCILLLIEKIHVDVLCDVVAARIKAHKTDTWRLIVLTAQLHCKFTWHNWRTGISLSAVPFKLGTALWLFGIASFSSAALCLPMILFSPCAFALSWCYLSNLVT